LKLTWIKIHIMNFFNRLNQKLKEKLCKALDHKLVPVWNREKDFKDFSKATDKIIVLGCNEWKCERCGQIFKT